MGRLLAKCNFELYPQEHMQGFLFVDKSAGPTSHDVVDGVRKRTSIKKVGHAGTLDPFATGLLLIGVGRPATREMQHLVGLDKTYEAVFVLGARSDTGDIKGKIELSPIHTLPLTKERLNKALQQFTGEIQQVPPAYSAIKVKGKKLYESARAGKPIKVEPRTVTIYSADATEVQDLASDGTQRIALTLHVSSGTYIRAIARDLGVMLGGGGYVEQLRRTRIGPFSIEEAKPLSALTPECIQTALVPIQTILERASTERNSR